VLRCTKGGLEASDRRRTTRRQAATARLLPDADLIEYICEENNSALVHMGGR